MRTILAAITIGGLLAGMADSSPLRSLNKRKVEAKRDARTSAPAKAASTPAPAPAPPGPSALSRDKKPPSTRFHARVRTDLDRDKTKKKGLAGLFTGQLRKEKKAKAEESAATDANEKDLFYRRHWGPRGRNRTR